MNDCAPLLLFSSDLTGAEQSAPIDALPYVKASTLNGNLTLGANPQVILNPSPASSPQAGTITATRPTLPVKLYLSPTSAVYGGSDWATAIQCASLGLNDHDLGLHGLKRTRSELPQISQF